ncbi:Alpha-1-antiproteinase [Intoshia linei]|uniref:Alpha-1-antiproteinase n=1 Tax=Intoshia linei TaxID=1819745 RepID=A0A177AW91_9BILA|nr:Alpha-1-antiproteinase [Intoshia linei]
MTNLIFLLFGLISLTISTSIYVSQPNFFSILLWKVSSVNGGKMKKNVVISPPSIEVILKMLFHAMPKSHRNELKSYGHFREGTFQHDEITNLKEAQSHISKKDFEFEFENKLFIAYGFIVKNNYLNNILKYLGVTKNSIQSINFNQSFNATNTINHFISKVTRNRINKIIFEGDISSDTRVVLVNAVYLKAAYMVSFNKRYTQKRDFKSFSMNRVTKVDTMYMPETTYKYLINKEMQIVQIPYKVKGLNLIVVKRFDGKNIENSERVIDEFYAQGQKGPINLFLPKFSISSKVDLKPILESMNIRNIFSKDADFSEITDNKLKVEKIIHVANIDVDEVGTTAAAATAAFMSGRSLAEIPDTIRMDSSFSAYLTYGESRMILFSAFVDNLN